MDHLLARLKALEHQTTELQHHTHQVTRQLHWWRGLACDLMILGEEEPIPDCPNGLGNLIAGYNETREPRGFGEDIRTGSHSVVVGRFNNFCRFGGLVIGDFSTISGDFAAVSGGNANTASGEFSSVNGGNNRTAEGQSDWVSGPLFADE